MEEKGLGGYQLNPWYVPRSCSPQLCPPERSGLAIVLEVRVWKSLRGQIGFTVEFICPFWEQKRRKRCKFICAASVHLIILDRYHSLGLNLNEQLTAQPYPNPHPFRCSHANRAHVVSVGGGQPGRSPGVGPVGEHSDSMTWR